MKKISILLACFVFLVGLSGSVSAVEITDLGPNLAYGKTFVGDPDSATYCCDVNNLGDGGLGSPNGSYNGSMDDNLWSHGGSGYPGWAYVDFGSEVTYNIVKVWRAGTAGIPKDFDLYWSNDAANWNFIGSYTTEPDQTVKVVGFIPITSRYLKIVVNDMYHEGFWVAFGELEVYSSTVGVVNTQVEVLTGTVGHGGTIPLPSGYTQDQCDWIVSVHDVEWREAPGNSRLRCYADINRVVTCMLEGFGAGYTGYGTADYMVVCTKDDLSSKVDALEASVQNLSNILQEHETKISLLESLINSVQNTVYDFMDLVNSYLFNLPKGLRQNMVCGALEGTNVTNATGFGLYCEINDKGACTCQSIQ